MRVMPIVNQLSVSSLPLQLLAGDESIANATGFLVERSGTRYLVSNWHVFAGKNPISGENLGSSFPTSVRVTTVAFNEKDRPVGRATAHDLVGPFDEFGDRPVLWKQHSRGRRVDIAALPLSDDFNFEPAPIDLHKQDYAGRPDLHFALDVADPVVIVGFPFGASAGEEWIAVWLHGHIASPPTLPYHGEERFLVDIRTRDGMSGSPVYFYPRGRRVWFAEGGMEYLVPGANQMLGIYSGRIDEKSDLGFVWRKSLIDEVIDTGRTGSYFD
jgi:hypothetical protein